MRSRKKRHTLSANCFFALPVVATLPVSRCVCHGRVFWHLRRPIFGFGRQSAKSAKKLGNTLNILNMLNDCMCKTKENTICSIIILFWQFQSTLISTSSRVFFETYSYCISIYLPCWLHPVKLLLSDQHAATYIL